MSVMNKILIIILTVFLLVSVTGCDSNQQDINQDSSSVTSENINTEFFTPDDAYFSANKDVSKLEHFIDTEGSEAILYGDYAEYSGQKWSEREDMRRYFDRIRERGSAAIVYPNEAKAEPFIIDVVPKDIMLYVILDTKQSDDRIWIRLYFLDEGEQTQSIKELFDTRYSGDEDLHKYKQKESDLYGEYVVFETRTRDKSRKHLMYRHKDCLVYFETTDGIDIENGYSEWFEIKEYTPNYK